MINALIQKKSVKCRGNTRWESTGFTDSFPAVPAFVSGSGWKQSVSVCLLVEFEMVMWTHSLELTLRVTKISRCAASPPGGAHGGPHAPELPWQAVNHVWSFICQSLPKCGTVRWTIPHDGVTQPPPAVRPNGCQCVSEPAFAFEVFWLIRLMMSLQQLQRRQIGQTPDWHRAALLISFTDFIWQLSIALRARM